MDNGYLEDLTSLSIQGGPGGPAPPSLPPVEAVPAAGLAGGQVNVYCQEARWPTAGLYWTARCQAGGGSACYTLALRQHLPGQVKTLHQLFFLLRSCYSRPLCFSAPDISHFLEQPWPGDHTNIIKYC